MVPIRLLSLLAQLALLLPVHSLSSASQHNRLRGVTTRRRVGTQTTQSYKGDNGEDEFLIQCQVELTESIHNGVVSHDDYAAFLAEYCQSNPGYACTDDTSHFWRLDPRLQRSFISESCPGNSFHQEECLEYLIEHSEQEFGYSGNVAKLCSALKDLVVPTGLVKEMTGTYRAEKVLEAKQENDEEETVSEELAQSPGTLSESLSPEQSGDLDNVYLKDYRSTGGQKDYYDDTLFLQGKKDKQYEEDDEDDKSDVAEVTGAPTPSLTDDTDDQSHSVEKGATEATIQNETLANETDVKDTSSSQGHGRESGVDQESGSSKKPNGNDASFANGQSESSISLSQSPHLQLQVETDITGSQGDGNDQKEGSSGGSNIEDNKISKANGQSESSSSPSQSPQLQSQDVKDLTGSQGDGKESRNDQKEVSSEGFKNEVSTTPPQSASGLSPSQSPPLQSQGAKVITGSQGDGEGSMNDEDTGKSFSNGENENISSPSQSPHRQSVDAKDISGPQGSEERGSTNHVLAIVGSIVCILLLGGAFAARTSFKRIFRASHNQEGRLSSDPEIDENASLSSDESYMFDTTSEKAIAASPWSTEYEATLSLVDQRTTEDIGSNSLEQTGGAASLFSRLVHSDSGAARCGEDDDESLCDNASFQASTDELAILKNHFQFEEVEPERGWRNRSGGARQSGVGESVDRIMRQMRKAPSESGPIFDDGMSTGDYTESSYDDIVNEEVRERFNEFDSKLTTGFVELNAQMLDSNHSPHSKTGSYNSSDAPSFRSIRDRFETRAGGEYSYRAGAGSSGPDSTTTSDAGSFCSSSVDQIKPDSSECGSTSSAGISGVRAYFEQSKRS